MSGAKLVRLSTDALQKELSFIESPFTTRVEYEKYMLGESAIDVSELAVKQESTTIVAPAAEERAAAVEAEVAAVRAAAEEAARQAAAALTEATLRAERAEAKTREYMKVASEQLKQMEAAERLRFNEVKSEAARETHRANKLQEEVNAAREEAKAAKAHAEGILKEAPEAAAKAVEKEAQDEFIEAMVNAGLAHSAWMKEIAAKEAAKTPAPAPSSSDTFDSVNHVFEYWACQQGTGDHKTNNTCPKCESTNTWEYDGTRTSYDYCKDCGHEWNRWYD